MNYLSVFSTKTEKEQLAEAAPKPNKFLAAHIRTRLSNGWPPESRFLKILAQIPDEVLIAMQKTHEAQKREHAARLAEARKRKAAASQTPLARLTARALANA